MLAYFKIFILLKVRIFFYLKFKMLSIRKYGHFQEKQGTFIFVLRKVAILTKLSSV